MEKMDQEFSSSQQGDFEQIISYSCDNEQQRFFDSVVSLLQQTLISPEFQKNIQLFMRNNWEKFGSQNSNYEQQIFQEYSNKFTEYLNMKLKQQIHNFELSHFLNLVVDRRNQVDEQILDTLDSFCDINSFKTFIRDYKISNDQVQTYKVLTIKNNKISQNKQVKGKDNIFGNNNKNPLFDMKKKPKSNLKSQQNTSTISLMNKTQDELLVPDIVLTVKGLRKG